MTGWAIAIGGLAALALIAWHVNDDFAVRDELADTRLENARLGAALEKQNEAVKGLQTAGEAGARAADLAALRELRAGDAARAAIGGSGHEEMNRWIRTVFAR